MNRQQEIDIAIRYTNEMIEQIKGLPESDEYALIVTVASQWVAELKRRKAAALH